MTERLRADLGGIRVFDDVEPDLLLVRFAAPFHGDLPTLERFVAFLEDRLVERGHPPAVMVDLAGIVALPGPSRRYLQVAITRRLLVANGAIARSALARAVASVFLGLGKLDVPTRVFQHLDDARQWTREMLDQARALRPAEDRPERP